MDCICCQVTTQAACRAHVCGYPALLSRLKPAISLLSLEAGRLNTGRKGIPRTRGASEFKRCSRLHSGRIFTHETTPVTSIVYGKKRRFSESPTRHRSMNSRDVRQSINHSNADFRELTELNRLSRREFPPPEKRRAGSKLAALEGMACIWGCRAAGRSKSYVRLRYWSGFFWDLIPSSRDPWYGKFVIPGVTVGRSDCDRGVGK